MEFSMPLSVNKYLITQKDPTNHKCRELVVKKKKKTSQNIAHMANITFTQYSLNPSEKIIAMFTVWVLEYSIPFESQFSAAKCLLLRP